MAILRKKVKKIPGLDEKFLAAVEVNDAGETAEPDLDGSSGVSDSGLLHEDGAESSDIQVDEPVELRQLRSAAEQGNVHAKYNLAIVYRDGRFGVAIDLDKAKRLLEEAARAGSDYAVRELGKLRPTKDAVCEATNEIQESNESSDDETDDERDEEGRLYVEMSCAELLECAKSGDVMAQIVLATGYAGETEISGLRKNVRSAEKWYKRAAETGNAEAQNHLGVLYSREGRFEEAFSLYKQSAEQQDVYGICNLANYYRKGYGCEQDFKEAERLYKIVLKIGDDEIKPEAVKALKEMETEKLDAAEDAYRAAQQFEEDGDFYNALEEYRHAARLGLRIGGLNKKIAGLKQMLDTQANVAIELQREEPTLIDKAEGALGSFVSWFVD